SNREYGARLQNGTLPNCYPLAIPPWGAPTRDPPPKILDWTRCAQPQIWMAAIDPDLTSADPSYPAFWLPYQSLASHNHSAQWTERVMTNCVPEHAACSSSDLAPCCPGTEGQLLACDPTTLTCSQSIM